MTITDETIDYVGILAKLELSDEEKEQAKQDMSNMLEYVSKLNELDTDSVEPMSHAFPVSNVLVTKQLYVSSSALIRSRHAFVASTTVTSLSLIFLPSSTAVNFIKSLLIYTALL